MKLKHEASVYPDSVQYAGEERYVREFNIIKDVQLDNDVTRPNSARRV